MGNEKLLANQLAKWLHDQLQPSAPPITVKEWAYQWLNVAVAGKSFNQKSAILNAFENHILQILGDKPIRDITFTDVAEVMAAVADYSYSLRSKVLVNMRSFFNAALKNHLIYENPCDGLKAGPNSTQEKIALTLTQQKNLEDAVHGTSAETFVLIGLYTGLRRGEILALQWDCIDLDAETPSLTVKRALHFEGNLPVVSEKLKSRAAYRTIPLPQCLVSHLKNLSHSGKYVIGNTAPLTRSGFRSMWKIIQRRTAKSSKDLGTVIPNTKIVRTLDFHVSPHLLRHTYITRMILGGANVKHVQYLAGHSNVQITLKIYTHLMDKSPDALAKSVSTVFDT